MTGVDILNGLEADGILTIVSTEFATDEGLFEVKHGMVRLVELRGPARQFNTLAGVLLRLLSSYQDKAWTAEDGHEGLDHSLSDSFGRMSSLIGERFHPISITQRAMKEHRSHGVMITAQGLDRIPGSKVGDRFEVDHFTDSFDSVTATESRGQVAHVRHHGSIWSLGVGDWEVSS